MTPLCDHTSGCRLCCISLMHFRALIVLHMCWDKLNRHSSEQEDTLFLQSFLEAFHRKQLGRFCCSRSCYLPLNGVRKPFCLLAGKQRDVDVVFVYCFIVWLLLFLLCGFSGVVCSRAVHTNAGKDNKCSNFEKKGSVFVKFVAVFRPPFAASMCVFILRLLFFLLLIQEHTLVSHTHAHIPVHKSHSGSCAHTSKHPHADTTHTYLHTQTHSHTHIHTLLTPAVAFCRPRHFDEPGTVCECS